MAEDIAAKEAKWGERMIEVKVRFWTNDIADKGILPKHGRCRGVVRIKSNKAHGIKAEPAVQFNSMAEISLAIEKCLIANGITLYESPRERKYRAPSKRRRA